MRYALTVVTILLLAACAMAQENTEVRGFYQGYGDFSWRTAAGFDIPATKLKGGGGGVAFNFAPWFALWTELAIYGRVEGPLSVRIVNELQGVRYQTNQYGPLRLYAKGGLGFTYFGIGNGSAYRPAFSYGGGAQIWMKDWIGLDLSAGQVLMGVPDISGLPGRDSWDSGLVYSAGVVVRF